MTFLQQARILNNLDSRVKLQPLPSDFEEWMGVMRYTLFGSRWSITGLKMKERSQAEARERFKNLIDLTKVCVKIQKLKITTPGNLRIHLLQTKYEEETIDNALRGIPDNTNLKALCVLLGIRTTMMSCTGNIIFSPAPSNIQPVIRRNLAGKQYKAYKGAETEYFRYKEVTGMFTHNEELITSIIMTLCSPQTAKVILASIGQYCRLGFSTSNASGKAQMMQETYKKIIERPEIIFRGTPGYTMGTHGIVCFREEVEFHTYPCGTLVFDENANIMDLQTGQVVEMENNKETIILKKGFKVPRSPIML